MAGIRNQQDDPETRAAVSRDLQTKGVRETARYYGLSRDATLAIAAGARVHPGTLALARERRLATRNST